MFVRTLVTEFDTEKHEDWMTASRYWRGNGYEPSEGNAYLLEAVADPSAKLVRGYIALGYGLGIDGYTSRVAREIWHDVLINSGVEWCGWPGTNEVLVVATEEQLTRIQAELWARLLHTPHSNAA